MFFFIFYVAPIYATSIQFNKDNFQQLKTNSTNLTGQYYSATNGVTVQSDDFEVSFPDINLERVIRKAIKKTTGVILKSDVEKITELHAQNQGIINLQNISFLINLEKLYLQDNLIEYFPTDEFSCLKKLLSVDLSNNLIKDRYSYNVTELNLSNISIADLNLSNNCIYKVTISNVNSSITKLDLSSNYLTEISDFDKLTNLKSLFLDGNHIDDFSPVKAYYNNLIDKDFILSSPSSTPTPSKIPFTFKDPKLEYEIRYVINRPSGQLYLSDLADITELNASSSSIKDLEGIENLMNLKVLRLSYNSIRNIEPLKSLKKLKVLDLNENKIVDISPLEGLNNLNKLYLSKYSETTGGISDINPIAKLTKLNTLYIDNNNISGLTPLASAANLLELSACGNKLSDLSTLSNNKELVFLQLFANEISNISALKNHIYLKYLYLGNNPLVSIKGLEGLHNLAELNLNSVGISDMSSLSGLSKLLYLDVANNNIRDISFLGNLSNLTLLYINKNKNINNINTIGKLKNLKELNISDNGIEDISFLSGLTNLTSLNASGNTIKNLVPLSGMQDMYKLNLTNNQISDISCLANIKKLKSLHLAFNNVIDYSPLAPIYNQLTDKDFDLSAPAVSGLKLNRNAISISIGNVPKKVTRAEFASFLVKAFDLKDNPDIPDHNFDDISKNDPYYRDICIAYKADLLGVYNGNKFEPSLYITRNAYVSTLLKYLKYNLIDSFYADYATDNGYCKRAGTIIAAGLMKLNEENLYEPNEEMLLDVEAQLVPIISPANAVNKKVKWSSSNQSVATVDNSGFVQGVSSGVAEITAQTLDGKYTVKCSVTVNNPNGNHPPTSPVTQNPQPTVPSSNNSSAGNQSGIGSQSVDTNNVSTPTPTNTPTASSNLTNTPSTTPIPTITPTSTLMPSATPLPFSSGNSTFKDLDKHWAKSIIEKLSSKGIIAGYPDGTIKPDSTMTRAEAAVLIAKAMGLKSISPKLTFKDAADIPTWASGYVQAVVDKGIIKGYEDGKFKPNNLLTRKEIVVMAVNAFGFEGTEDKLNFTDSNTIPNWAKSHISKAVSLNIINGYSDNTFKPDKAVTRAEACKILDKCLELSK